MASPRAILAATKATAGTARPTAPPQGSTSPWFGQISPMARDQDTSAGYASAYGPFLPRPPQDFTAGAFGPFSPILPVPVDTPEDDGRAVPRREQYEVGWNLPTGTPGSEGIKLATFQTLRSIADLYSVARSCIQLRKNEVKGIGWDIVPTPDAAKAMRGDKASMRDFGERRGKAMRFFHRPDPDYFTWSSWVGDVMEQMLVFDALSVFLQPKRARGMKKGLLGSDLDSLSLIDGETIRPLYDLNGATPRPPAPGYQQYLYGVPRTDLTSVITGRDIEQSGIAESAWKPFRGDQLLYLPVEKRRWTPYGFPPVERALLPIMAGLQKQGYALDFFREGTVPAVYISPGDATMTPNQIRELQDALNAIAGDPAFHHKIIVLPPGSKTEPQRPAALADQFDEVVMNWVCMSFDVSPMELGIAPKVSTTMSPGASNQMAKMSQGSQERKATKPTLEYLGAICDFILQEVCHQDDMRFLFEGLEEEEDEATKTTTLVTQIGAGLLSIDEGRGEIGKQPWGLPETSDPGWASATGFLPLGQMTTQGQPQAGFTQPDAAHPAGAPPTPGQPGQPGAPQQVAGGPQRAALPAGQAKPRTGPGRATAAQAQSPGHDAAVAAHDSGSGRGGGQRSAAASDKAAQIGAALTADTPPAGLYPLTLPPAAPAAGAVPVPAPLNATSGKAALAELDALARHLRKGRHITSWVPRHLPGAVMAQVAEDLTKGLTPGEAVGLAKAAWEHELRGPGGRWARSAASEEIGQHAAQWAGQHAGGLHPHEVHPDEVLAYRREHLDPVFHYTPAQVEAIHDYTEYAFKHTNDDLRGGGDGGKVAKALSGAMQPLPEDITLRRGLDDAHALDGLARGDVIADKGFSSTTLSTGGRYANPKYRTTIMHIMTPAGTPAVWTGVHASYPENEVILDAGQPLAFIRSAPMPGRNEVTEAWFVALPKSVAA